MKYKVGDKVKIVSLQSVGRSDCRNVVGDIGVVVDIDSCAAYDKDKAPYAYDPEKAKALLKEAGFAGGFEFEVTASPNESWGVPIVEAILPMLKKVGITVKPKPVESSALGEAVTANNFRPSSGRTSPVPIR